MICRRRLRLCVGRSRQDYRRGFDVWVGVGFGIDAGVMAGGGKEWTSITSMSVLRSPSHSLVPSTFPYATDRIATKLTQQHQLHLNRLSWSFTLCHLVH